jgi:hypothetical protein
MIGEFTAQAVTRQVLAHLERRRSEIASDDARVRAEVSVALEPVRRAYRDAELPAAYLAALEREVGDTVPAQWRRIAEPFTELEQRGFRLWRGGDVVARIVYVFVGLAIGGLCVELPFIPIWEKWFPFVLAVAAWWLPDLQVRWLRRRYARALGRIVESVAAAQPALEQHVTTKELMQ